MEGMFKGMVNDAHTIGIKQGLRIGFWLGVAAGVFFSLLISMAVKVMF